MPWKWKKLTKLCCGCCCCKKKKKKQQLKRKEQELVRPGPSTEGAPAPAESCKSEEEPAEAQEEDESAYFATIEDAQEKGCCCFCKPIPPPKLLYVFDFDCTIVIKNSEYIYKSVVAKKKGVPEASLPQPPLPVRWEHMCQALVDYVFGPDCQVTLAELLNEVRQIPLVPGMDIVLETLVASILKRNYNARFIILSGANDLFIRTVLRSLNPPIYPNEIISNHAYEAVDGRSFDYELHSNQTVCKLCNRALCKGGELEWYFESHGRFEQVHFICDGTNDVCPAMRLREQDAVYVRNGYGLDALIRRGQDTGLPLGIRAKVIYWTDGFDLIDKLLPGVAHVVPLPPRAPVRSQPSPLTLAHPRARKVQTPPAPAVMGLSVAVAGREGGGEVREVSSEKSTANQAI